jgi:hypothetical protein
MSTNNYWGVRVKELVGILHVRKKSLLDEAILIGKTLTNWDTWIRDGVDEEYARKAYYGLKELLVEDTSAGEEAVELLREVEVLRENERKRALGRLSGGCSCGEHELEAKLEGARGRLVQENRLEKEQELWEWFFKEALKAGMESGEATGRESLISGSEVIANLALAAVIKHRREAV